MKKKITILSSFLLVFICILSFVKKKDKITFFSDYILYPLDENIKKDKYNYSFSNTNLTSELLLEYLDYNAVEIKENIKINDLIKKSKKIYISVGMNDLLRYISLLDNKLTYSSTLINEKIALLEYNIYEIINSILAISDVEIYYLSLYYLNDDDFDELIKEFNEEIKDLVNSMEANYIEINEIVYIEDYKFTFEEQKKIYNNI